MGEIVVKKVKNKKKENKTEIQTLGEYVIINKAPPEDISAGGIILEGVYQEIHEGTVKSVGKDVTEIEVGDTVLLPPMAGRVVNIRGYEAHILTQSEVMVKILD